MKKCLRSRKEDDKKFEIFDFKRVGVDIECYERRFG